MYYYGSNLEKRGDKMDKKKRIAIVVLCLILIIAVAISVWAIFFRKGEDVLPPDYPPQETEKNQIPIPDDQGGTIQTPDGGGAVNVTYSQKIDIDLSDKSASLYYANPSRSTQNVAIAIVIGEEVILRSELITPGNMVKSLPLVDGIEKKLVAGGYNATLVVYCYDPETGERAMVDATSSVTLTVTE